jgi:hypothetical protein
LEELEALPPPPPILEVNNQVILEEKAHKSPSPIRNELGPNDGGSYVEGYGNDKHYIIDNLTDLDIV